MPRPSIFSFEAIGTHWWVESLAGQSLSEEIKVSLTRYAAEFDRLYSRFRDDSLIGQLNTSGVLANPPQELLDMLQFCQEMYVASGGAFNISVGGKLHELGYGARAHTGKLYENPFQEIIYNEREIRTPRDMTLDTGGYGKGWLIDAFASRLHEQGVTQFIVNGGGDMYVDSETPIEIALEHPYDGRETIGSTRITKGALAVSGTAKRAWQHDGKQYHHLIDPRTHGSLANDVAGVYVRADTALIADTMATILMIRPELADGLSRQYSLQVKIVRNDQLS